MKTFDTDSIRNVALIGHSGEGKTSLAEAIMFDRVYKYKCRYLFLAAQIECLLGADGNRARSRGKRGQNVACRGYYVRG